MTILAVILAALFLLTAGMGFFLARFSMRIRPQTLQEARAWQEAHYDLGWYDPLKKEDYSLKSFDGTDLHVQCLHAPAPSGKAVLISHGYTDNRFGALKYAKLYLDLGFDVIVYDLRGHGENERTFCTYSVREGRDLDVLVRDCRERYPFWTCLGLHGESLGAASSVACLKYAPSVDFVVSDCGFAEIESVMRGGLKGMHLPPCLVSPASLWAKGLYGFSYREMRPVDSLKGNRVPVLFLHGEKDTFIPPDHSRRMKEADAGYSEMYLIPGAGHAASVLTDPEAYREHVTGFLTRVGILDAKKEGSCNGKEPNGNA